MKRIFALLFLLSAAAFAQTTVVTGTVVDPSGYPYAGGTILPQLISPGGPTPTLNGNYFTPSRSPATLDGRGAFSLTVQDNSQISPASTKWQFTVCSGAGSVQPATGGGSVCFSVTLTISGSSQDISAQLQAAALPLTNNTTAARFPYVPLVQYLMTDASGSNVPDSSGNANNGTLTAGTINSQGINMACDSNISIPVSTWANTCSILLWYKSLPVGKNMTAQTVGGVQALFDNATSNYIVAQNPQGQVGEFVGGAGNPILLSSQPEYSDSFVGITFGATPHIYQGPLATETTYASQTGFGSLSGTPASVNLGSFPAQQDFFCGTFYAWQQYSQCLTQPLMAQADAAMQPALAKRGVNIHAAQVPDVAVLADSVLTCNGTYPCSVDYGNFGNILANLGISGQTCATVLASLNLTVLPIAQPGSVILVSCGADDIGGNNTAASVYANLQSICTAIHQMGYFCVDVTVTPAGAGFSGGQTAAGYETARNTLNTDIVTDTTGDFDAIADIGNDPLCGTPGGASGVETNATLYTISEHPNATCNAVFGVYLSDAISAALHRGPSCTTYALSNNGTDWTITVNGQVVPYVTNAIAAATTQSIPLKWIQRSKVESITFRTTTAWSGSGVTSVTATPGDSVGGTTFYGTTTYQLTTAPGSSNFQDYAVGGKSGSNNGSNLTINLTANQNLNLHPITGTTNITVCTQAVP